MRMDYDDSARFVHGKEPIRCAIKVGKDRIGTDTVCIKHLSRCICCKYDAPDFCDLVSQAGCIAADRNFAAAGEGCEGSKIIPG